MQKATKKINELAEITGESREKIFSRVFAHPKMQKELLRGQKASFLSGCSPTQKERLSVDIDAKIAEALRKRAGLNYRTLAGEVRAILTQFVGEAAK